MGFGEDLRCPQAHAAVMRLLDSELHLMEIMKKWMGQRAKSEREFSVQLHQMTLHDKGQIVSSNVVSQLSCSFRGEARQVCCPLPVSVFRGIYCQGAKKLCW
uniref:FCH domain-containing protein n=1 Tax=Poecilia mexicana TaxID=48701 RepID=A0A3B3WSV2_9TELE